MAHIQSRAQFPRFCATLRFSDERQPPVPQLNAFLKGNRDQGAHVLYRERGRRDSALAFMHLTLGGEHANPYQAGDESARLPWLLVDSRILENVRERDGVEREQALVPLRRA